MTSLRVVAHSFDLVKWFNRDWAESRLSEDQMAAVSDEYAEHIEEVRATHPELSALLDLNLHDAQAQWAQATEDDRGGY